MENLNSIWDGFMLASEISNKRDELRRLKETQFHSQNSCGSCYHWMTKQCPNESPKNKVTCNGRICAEFKMCSLTKKHNDERELNIKELENYLLCLTKKGIKKIIE